MSKLTVKELLDLKGKRQISFFQVTSEAEAIAASTAGIDMMGTAFIPEREHFPSLVPNTHFQLGLPWGKHASAEEALRDSMKAMENGAESIYCGMSPHIIEVLAREGVPVIAHIGLVPPKATWVGGFKAVGKTAKQAFDVFTEAKAFESAGAFALEMEVIPSRVAAEITQQVAILTISLGSGQQCDATYLFSADLLGENRGHIPRHAKVYRNFAAENDRLQNERIKAYGEYIADINNKNYPQDEHSVSIMNNEFDTLLNQVNNVVK